MVEFELEVEVEVEVLAEVLEWLDEAPKKLEIHQILPLCRFSWVLIGLKIVSFVFDCPVLERYLSLKVPHLLGCQEKLLHVFAAGDKASVC